MQNVKSRFTIYNIFLAPRETLTFGLTGEDDEDSDDMDDEDQAFLFG